MLPVKDGFSLAQSIRQSNRQVPILFVTAKSMLEDKITAFELGADDYLTKPFSMEELILRIEVFLRRSMANQISPTISIGRFEFDSRNLTLRNEAGIKNLTQKEAELLKLLCENKDQVLRREEILKKVWGNDDYFMGRSMDVFISKLRKYLKEDSTIQIVNYHGVGFKLDVKTL
jgi:DNA-binding response OmpR family regulator